MERGPSAADGWERFARARRGPLAEGAFPSRLHGERSAALLGIALGIAFTVCFVTGLMSHLVQRGPHSVQDWWPSRPVSLYRVTQGVHVLTGMAAVPLLLAKMWVAYPRLWSWPPVRDVLHAVERLALLALVGGAIFQLATGLLNVFYWYAFPFNFPLAHYAGAWIAMGGLIIHVGAKWEAARRGLARPRADAPVGGLTRRGFLTVIGATSTHHPGSDGGRGRRPAQPAGRARAAAQRPRPPGRAGEPHRVGGCGAGGPLAGLSPRRRRGGAEAARTTRWPTCAPCP